jgi:hypothetical protein
MAGDVEESLFWRILNKDFEYRVNGWELCEVCD